MSYAKRLLDTYPRTVALDTDIRAAAIEAMQDCAQACTADVDADLSAANLTDMVKCIRLCLHCADVSTATAAVASRPVEGGSSDRYAPRPGAGRSRPAAASRGWAS